MSEYPPGSTAKIYRDLDGNEVTLPALIRSEPDWARSRIVVCEKYEAYLKSIATDFFREWYNAPGSNTDQGFDDWWKANRGNYDL